MLNLKTTALVLAAAAAYCSCAAAENGVKANEILVGQSASLTGTNAETGLQVRDGANAYFELVNRKGGIHGRKIRMISLDDAGNTKKGEENTKRLIEQDKVFLLFGYTARTTADAALPMIEKHDVPFFGAATGGENLHGAFNRNVFNVRAGYNVETQALVRYLVSTGQKKIGMIYHKDDVKKTNLKMTEDAAAAYGIKLAGSATVERNSADVREAVDVMAKIVPEAVLMNAGVKPVGQFVRDVKRAGIGMQVVVVSFVGSPIVPELGPDAAGLIMSQVVPLPTKKQIPIVGEYQRTLAEVGAKPEYSFNGLEGFIGAKVLVEGLKRAGKDLTRARFKKGVESISDWDLGGYYVNYSPSNHNGSTYVDITVINRQGRFFN